MSRKSAIFFAEDRQENLFSVQSCKWIDPRKKKLTFSFSNFKYFFISWKYPESLHDDLEGALQS